MKHELEITSAEQAKVLAHPLRLRIISFYDDGTPKTSKQLADLLEMPPAKVHYHVRELVKAEILQLVETKEKGGVIEKYYLPVAEKIRINLSNVDTGEDIKQSPRYLFVKSAIDEYRNAFLQSSLQAEQRKSEQNDSKSEAEICKQTGPLYSHSNLLMSEAEALELRGELDALLNRWVDKLKDKNRKMTDDQHSYGLLLSLYEKPTQKNKTIKTMRID